MTHKGFYTRYLLTIKKTFINKSYFVSRVWSTSLRFVNRKDSLIYFTKRQVGVDVCIKQLN